jgi:nucleotide-binding universal stress UspA family protein
MKRILVPTDFSPASDRALEQAGALARASRAEVCLLHKVIYPPPHPPTELLDRLDDAARFDYVLKEVIERPEREAQEGLESRKKNLEGGGVAVKVLLERSGDVYERLERAIDSLKPDLVVMGTHGRGGIQKWLMGSVAEKALRHSPVDVLTLHADSPVAPCEGGIGEILVATDFSDGSRRALEAARRLVAEIGGSICLLHVIESRFAPRRGDMAPSPLEVSPEIRAQAEKALRDELGSDRSGKDKSVVAEGDVVREIDRVAEERLSSLIAVGSHGLTGVRRALLGSVAEKVARFCHLPILTVR